ncbi:MAG TPA: hypothetical protein VFU47_01025, partial [Armatimonadota bacterium]|nr:hypothetical protein [Armatimonadota bacterium]
RRGMVWLAVGSLLAASSVLARQEKPAARTIPLAGPRTDTAGVIPVSIIADGEPEPGFRGKAEPTWMTAHAGDRVFFRARIKPGDDTQSANLALAAFSVPGGSCDASLPEGAKRLRTWPEAVLSQDYHTPRWPLSFKFPQSNAVYYVKIVAEGFSEGKGAKTEEPLCYRVLP